MPPHFLISFLKACSSAQVTRGVHRRCRALDSPPPRRLPRRTQHFPGRIFKESDMLKGAYDIISGVAEWLIPSFSTSSPRLRRATQRRLFRVGTPPQSPIPFVEMSSPAYGLHAASIIIVGPWTLPSPPPSSTHPATPWPDPQGVRHAERYVRYHFRCR